jgi:hypothetical protein
MTLWKRCILNSKVRLLIWGWGPALLALMFGMVAWLLCPLATQYAAIGLPTRATDSCAVKHNTSDDSY